MKPDEETYYFIYLENGTRIKTHKEILDALMLQNGQTVNDLMGTLVLNFNRVCTNLQHFAEMKLDFSKAQTLRNDSNNKVP